MSREQAPSQDIRVRGLIPTWLLAERPAWRWSLKDGRVTGLVSSGEPVHPPLSNPFPTEKWVRQHRSAFVHVKAGT